MKINILILLLLGCYTTSCAQNASASKINFDNDWTFAKDIDTIAYATSVINGKAVQVNWQNVSLPHTAHIEPVEKVNQQWQGICWYRKFFRLKPADREKDIAVQIDAAMSIADVYINGKHVERHLGGYLPFRINITPYVKFNDVNYIVIKLDNRDNAEVPPGKPIKDLDFNYYGGLYRHVWLLVKNKIHLTDPVSADHVNGGGVLVHYSDVSAAGAVIHVKSEVLNNGRKAKPVHIKTMLIDAYGKTVGQSVSRDSIVSVNGFRSYDQEFLVKRPQLWSPESPRLYRLKVYVIAGDAVIDSTCIRTGIHSIEVKSDCFYLNGNKYLIRGTNRHQEYPYIGNALSDNAQYRDAYKIKQAGFNFVRCSHYPPSPAFLDACDELGILVMDSTPGWQYFGDQVFQERSLNNIRDMIHRDRNHPCIALWEASLNETGMKRDYMEKANAEVHAELPYQGVYTCGWIEGVYDVFIPARQHAKAPDYWKKHTGKPLLIAEYGDWEYYAQNAGFNQTEYQNLQKEEKSSRQIRKYGEERLLQQALNYQEAHNDNLKGPMLGDLIWLIFDYKRGYATDLETSGIMDIFRVPKFAYYFFKSQQDAAKSSAMIYIASYWNDTTTKVVKVYSNCQQVELSLNGRIFARQSPDTGKNASELNHAPFTFHVKNYEKGTLKAIGYIDGKKAVQDERTTPGEPSEIILKVDESGRKLKSGCNDAVFVYAYITDDKGTLIPDAENKITLTLHGDGQIIGDSAVNAEAGIGAFLVKAGYKKGELNLSATAKGFKAGQLKVRVN